MSAGWVYGFIIANAVAALQFFFLVHPRRPRNAIAQTFGEPDVLVVSEPHKPGSFWTRGRLLLIRRDLVRDLSPESTRALGVRHAIEAGYFRPSGVGFRRRATEIVATSLFVGLGSASIITGWNYSLGSAFILIVLSSIHAIKEPPFERVDALALKRLQEFGPLARAIDRAEFHSGIPTEKTDQRLKQLAQSARSLGISVDWTEVGTHNNPARYEALRRAFEQGGRS